MLDFIEVSLGSGGAVACGRCTRAAAPVYRPAFEVTAEVEAACAAWGAIPGPNVAFVGPEPFGHPELAAVLSETVRAGIRRLRLDTDAHALASPEAAAAAVSAGVRHLRVTILGGSSAVHDELAHTPGGLDLTLAGIRGFASAAEAAGIRVAISARIPVCRHDCHDLPNAVARAAEAGATHALVEVADPALDVVAAMPWIAAACDSGTVNCLWVELAGVPYCLAGAHALHLVPVFRTVVPGAKAEACATCALDASCTGLPSGATPQVKAALAPPAEETRLAEAIRRAYVDPGSGEEE